ncbi:MAG: helix-hairpin-helix domain-containing protein [Terriglobia bacterium]
MPRFSWFTFVAAAAIVSGLSGGAVSAQDKRTESRSEKREQAATHTSGPVNLNTASEKELDALPQVGPATAKKIVGHRPYKSVDDLRSAGLSAKQIDTIRSLVTAGAGGAVQAQQMPVPAPRSSAPTAGIQPSPQQSVSPRTPAPSPRNPQSSRMQGTQTAPSSGSGMVWVNEETKVFHREGDQWYGKTKKGAYMSEADAVHSGYRAAKK